MALIHQVAIILFPVLPPGLFLGASMIRYLTIGCAILSLTACCDCRTRIDADELQQLKIGQTTEDDVKATFGVPSAKSSQDNDTIWAYNYAYEDTTWTNYIPVFGGLVGGMDKKTQKDSFVFDAQGKLKSYSRTDETTLPGYTPPK